MRTYDTQTSDYVLTKEEVEAAIRDWVENSTRVGTVAQDGDFKVFGDGTAKITVQFPRKERE